MSRRPYAEHRACHIAHVPLWPLHAKVWIAWGVMGWRPGVVVGHRKSRVTVRVTDGRHPFTASWFGRRSGVSHCAPNSLRVRRGDDRPTESASSPRACVYYCAKPTP